MRDDAQLAVLLRLWREGMIEPEAIDGLGPLPARSSRAERGLHNFFRVSFGLRLADGTDEPMMVATSLPVKERIVGTQAGASKLLRRFERLKIVWSPGSMPPINGNRDGTKLWLPGAKPDGPEPPGGWLNADPEQLRVRPAGSDGVPDAALEGCPVPVEAEDVERGVAVEPAVEAPDEPGVGDAVAGSSATGLDHVVAPGDAASLLGVSRHALDDNRLIGGQYRSVDG